MYSMVSDRSPFHEKCDWMLEGEEDNLILLPNPFASMEHIISSVRRRKVSVQPELMAILEKE